MSTKEPKWTKGRSLSQRPATNGPSDFIIFALLINVMYRSAVRHEAHGT